MDGSELPTGFTKLRLLLYTVLTIETILQHKNLKERLRFFATVFSFEKRALSVLIWIYGESKKTGF